MDPWPPQYIPSTASVSYREMEGPTGSVYASMRIWSLGPENRCHRVYSSGNDWWPDSMEESIKLWAEGSAHKDAAKHHRLYIWARRSSVWDARTFVIAFSALIKSSQHYFTEPRLWLRITVQDGRVFSSSDYNFDVTKLGLLYAPSAPPKISLPDGPYADLKHMLGNHRTYNYFPFSPGGWYTE